MSFKRMFRLDHNVESLPSAFGISEARAAELWEKAMVLDITSGKKSAAIEQILNDESLTDIETIYTLVTYGRISGESHTMGIMKLVGEDAENFADFVEKMVKSGKIKKVGGNNGKQTP